LLALSASAVVNGAYVPFQIATMPNEGGPYHYITSLPNDANDPDFTPDGATIVFWSFPSSGPDLIYSVPAAGGELTQIQTGCSNDPNCLGDDNPAVSPSGRELLTLRALAPFDNNGCPVFVGIYRFHLDGSHAKQLSPSGAPSCAGDYEPRWSPDGRRIVFQYQDGSGLSSLWIMNRDGSHRHQVTPAGLDIGNPHWSPDGRRFVFQSPAEAANDQTPQQIYTIRVDGTHLVQLTHYAPEAGITIKSYGTHWSPDGRKLVFAHVDSTTTIGPDGQHHADLFVMNPDGSEVVQIDFTPDRENSVAWGAQR
jgi:Tol biopolymer transport system component